MLPGMGWNLDARIPVSFAATPGEGPPAAWVSEAPCPALPPGAVVAASFGGGAQHVAGCACCTGRSAAAQALDRLFQARVRQGCAWFDRVVAPPEDADALRAALKEDVMAAVRFRLA